MKHPKGKYAWTVKIGEKGQFIILKEARDIFDINPGDTIIVLSSFFQSTSLKGLKSNHLTRQQRDIFKALGFKEPV